MIGLPVPNSDLYGQGTTYGTFVLAYKILAIHFTSV
jgi:hypothetical protein